MALAALALVVFGAYDSHPKKVMLKNLHYFYIISDHHNARVHPITKQIQAMEVSSIDHCTYKMVSNGFEKIRYLYARATEILLRILNDRITLEYARKVDFLT